MAKFSRKDLAQYIAENLDNNEALAEKIAGFLIDHGKVSELGSIMRDVINVRAQVLGVVELTATSAFPLDNTAKNQIENLVKERFSGVSKIIIHEKIDKTLLGGVDLDFANANLDLTIRAKLNKLRSAVA
jgi:F-type H+-transporting ATPase subunit delta